MSICNAQIAARNQIIVGDGDEVGVQGCTIFLGYTSNLVSSGLRETLRFLVQHKLVDCIVTTAGGVEEDFIKCLAPTLVGDFGLKGQYLRENGINRIGNLLVPNNNYCKFEDWVNPILDQLVEEQKKNSTTPDGERFVWTPSKIIAKLGNSSDNTLSNILHISDKIN